MPPVIFAGGQAYTIQGQYAIPHPDVSIDRYLPIDSHLTQTGVLMSIPVVLIE